VAKNYLIKIPTKKKNQNKNIKPSGKTIIAVKQPTFAQDS
jgi:hypothetical protein